MSLSSTTNRVAYVGDGSSTVFSFPYYFFNQADLKVFIYDTTSGSTVSQVLNTNFTVSGTVNPQGLYSSGGNVVMASAVVSTQQVVITRGPSEVQNFVLQQNGLIPSTSLTQQFDYLTLLIQRETDRNSRSVRVSDGFAGTFNTTLPDRITLAPLQTLVVNSSGTGFDFVASGSGLLGTAGYVLTGNGIGTPASFQPLSLSGSSVTGNLSLSNGGTGGLTPQTWGVVFASSATQLATTDPGPVGFALISNASSAPTFKQFNFATAGSGFIPISGGGTGQSTANAAFNALSPLAAPGDIIIYGSNAAAVTLAVGAAKFVLTSNGATTQPTWQSANVGSSALLVVNNLNDVASVAQAWKNISPGVTWGDTIYVGSGLLGTVLTAGTSGQFLRTGGTGAAPSWATQNYGSSALLVTNNLSDVAASAQAWKNISPGTVWGDVIYVGSGLLGTRLAAGTSGNVLSTGGAGAAPSWIAPLVNPMNTGGDTIYGGAAGVVTRLANGTSGQVLQSAGGTSAPAWQTLQGNSTALKAPTAQKFIATGTQTGWLFTISTTSTLAVGDTYSNNSNTYTVQGALSGQSGTVLFMSGTGATSGTTLTRTAGAGTASITFSTKLATATYTTPSGPTPLYLEIEMVGGGAGGAGSASVANNNGGSSTTAAASYFGANLLATGGGIGATGGAGQGGGGGGGAAVTSPAVALLAIAGGQGSGSGEASTGANNFVSGSPGGANPFGGAGGAGPGNAPGLAGQTNTGAGGGGAGCPQLGATGSGGGAGAYVKAIIPTPGATFPYIVGTGTAGGIAGTGTGAAAGGAGADGQISIKECYQ